METSKGKGRRASPKFIRAGELWRMYGRAFNGLQALKQLSKCPELSLLTVDNLNYRIRDLEQVIKWVGEELPHAKLPKLDTGEEL